MSEHGQKRAGTQVTERGITPRDTAELFGFAKAACEAGIAKSPAEAMMQAQFAMESGIGIVTVLASTYIVKGKLSMFGPLPAMLAQRSGLCEWTQECWLWDGEEFATLPPAVDALDVKDWPNGLAAVFRAKRKGSPELAERVFSVAQAKRAGLWNSTDNWRKRPDSMLMARARGHVYTYTFADALYGGVVLEPDEEIDRTPRAAEYEVRQSAADALLPSAEEMEQASEKAQAWLRPSAAPADDKAADLAEIEAAERREAQAENMESWT